MESSERPACFVNYRIGTQIQMTQSRKNIDNLNSIEVKNLFNLNFSKKLTFSFNISVSSFFAVKIDLPIKYSLFLELILRSP